MFADWEVIGAGSDAWFAASSHAHAASLAGPVVALLPDGVPMPDLDVRADGVRVRVRSAAGGPDLLPAISAAARTLGLTADPGGLQELRLVLGSPEPAALRPFWRTVLGYADADAGTLADRLRRGPALRLEQSDDARPLRNRIHVDAGYPGPIRDSVAAVTAGGGREIRASEWYSTLSDRDGNEVDLVPGGELGEGPTADWSVLFGAMACYPDLAPGPAAELAAAAADRADAAGIALGIDVRPEAVVLDSGKDQWEAAGFADLAGAVQDAARAAGLAADNSRLRFVQAVIDAVDVPAVREFWRAVLGYVPAPDPRIPDLYDPRWLNPVLLFQPMDAAEADRRRQRNRTHVELLVPSDQLRTRVDAAVAAGAGPLGEDPVPDGHRLADPEGNELVLRARPATAGPGRSVL